MLQGKRSHPATPAREANEAEAEAEGAGCVRGWEQSLCRLGVSLALRGPAGGRQSAAGGTLVSGRR